jgi:Tfp pilus assembly protein PilO
VDKDKKAWIGVLSTTAILGIGLVSLIYMKQGDISTARQGVVGLETRIGAARKTIEGTAGLEQEVIILREVSTVIEQILPGVEDLNGLNDDFHQYATDAQVRATAFKLKPDRNSGARGPKPDFEKVGYSLNLEGGIFQFLDFLNRIETHHSFLAIPSFKVSSSTRQEIDRHGEARHQIQVDVETYTYSSKGDLQPVHIEGYARKRDLLAAEVNHRRKALTVGRYDFRGGRGRRDPWIDPRVPEIGEDDGWPVPDQLAKVDDLAAMAADAMQQWLAVESAQNVLDRMVKKDELQAMLGELDEELRRVEAEGAITYVPAQKRLESDVYGPRAILGEELESGTGTGPTLAELKAIQAQMAGHIEHGEYDLALQVYGPMRAELEFVANDPVRNEVAVVIHDLAVEAETLRDFNAIELLFTGSFFIGDRAAIVINGRPRTVGDTLSEGLEVADIRENEIDFYFRGFVLTRVY